jgi:phage baseplate assembly protein W
MANLQKIYSDLDLTFNRQPGTNDIALSFDDQAVIRSIRHLLLTNHFERPWQPDLGSNLDAFLFENVDALQETSIAKEIENTIKNFEPRARVVQIVVNVTPDKNAYSAQMTFFIGNNTQPTTINLLLQRNR